MSDDQMAILGCGAALLISMVVMTLSAQVGKFVRREDAEMQPESVRVQPSEQRRRAA
jgi:hypothetical protein